MKTILVVEADPAVLGVLRIALTMAGFRISEASSGGEALRALEKDSPDGVVLDLMLPDDQVRAVLDRLRQGEVSGPAWVVTSVMDPAEVRHRYGDLEGRFFPKPFNPWNLANSLRRSLR